MTESVDLTSSAPMLTMQDLRAGERRQLARLFSESVFPLLTPLAIDLTHPLPTMRDGTLLVCCGVSELLGGGDDDGARRVVAAGSAQDLRRLGNRPAVIPLPEALDRAIVLDRGHRQVGIGGDELVRAHADQLFPGLAVVKTVSLRLHATQGATGDMLDLRDRQPIGMTVTSWADADLAAELLSEVAEIAEVRLVASLHRPDPVAQARRPRQLRTGQLS